MQNVYHRLIAVTFTQNDSVVLCSCPGKTAPVRCTLKKTLQRQLSGCITLKLFAFLIAVAFAGATAEYGHVEDDGGHVAGVYCAGDTVDDTGGGGGVHWQQGAGGPGFFGNVAGVEQQFLESVPVLVAQQSFQEDQQGVAVQQGELQ